jgi:hypothetical protein
MLEAIESFAAECKRQGAADLEAAQAFALEVTQAAEQTECELELAGATVKP